MRVTEKTIFDTASRNAGTLRDRLQQAVNENSTGLRVQHPWDEAGVTASLIAHRLTATRQDAMATTAERANDELNAADSSLGGMTEILSRAHELAIQLSSDNYSASDRTIAAEEVKSLFADTVGLLNTRVGDRYIFSGFQDHQPAFDTAGVYQGDSGVRQVESFPGVMQSVSLAGNAIASGATGGPDILGTLTALQTALTTNSTAGVRATLDNIDDGIEHLSLSRAQLGAASNALNIATKNDRDALTTEKQTISSLSEADVFESATKLALAQRALEASLTASARSFDLTLLNKL